MRLFIEAFVVGIITVIVGFVMMWVVVEIANLVRGQQINRFGDISTYYLPALSLFLTGFAMHLLFEFSGINTWYCKNGVAARKIKSKEAKLAAKSAVDSWQSAKKR